MTEAGHLVFVGRVNHVLVHDPSNENAEMSTVLLLPVRISSAIDAPTAGDVLNPVSQSP